MAGLLSTRCVIASVPSLATWSCRTDSRRCGSTSQRHSASSAPATRRAHQHNGARRFVEQALFDALAASARETVDSATVRERVRYTDEVRAALEWMWPVLTPAQLLHDLFGSGALLRLAARNSFDEDEVAQLVRPRSSTVDEVRWTDADIPLLDEAFALLGPKPARAGQESEELRTYGHIVIDEAQDLTPMALRMVSRRSLNGSITMVGDLAQATGAIAPSSWDDILAHLPSRKPPRVRELTIGYRIPAQSMALAARVLSVAAPSLVPPRSVREGDVPPIIRRVAGAELVSEVASSVEALLAALGDGSVAVVTPGSQADLVASALSRAASRSGARRARRSMHRSRWCRSGSSRDSSSTASWSSSRAASSTRSSRACVRSTSRSLERRSDS